MSLCSQERRFMFLSTPFSGTLSPELKASYTLGAEGLVRQKLKAAGAHHSVAPLVLFFRPSGVMSMVLFAFRTA